MVFIFYVILMTFCLYFNKNNAINRKVIIINISFTYYESIANKMLSTTKNDYIVPDTFTILFFYIFIYTIFKNLNAICKL